MLTDMDVKDRLLREDRGPLDHDDDGLDKGQTENTTAAGSSGRKLSPQLPPQLPQLQLRKTRRSSSGLSGSDSQLDSMNFSSSSSSGVNDTNDDTLPLVGGVGGVLDHHGRAGAGNGGVGDLFSPPKLMRCTSTPAAIATISFTSGKDVRGPGDHKKRTGGAGSTCWPLKTGGPKKPWLSSVPKFPSSDDSTASASAVTAAASGTSTATAAANVTSDSDSGFGTDLSSLSSSPCSSSSISGSGGGGAIPKQLRRGQGGGAPSSTGGVTTRSRTASSSDNDSQLFLTPEQPKALVIKRAKHKNAALKDRDLSRSQWRSHSRSGGVCSQSCLEDEDTSHQRECCNSLLVSSSSQSSAINSMITSRITVYSPGVFIHRERLDIVRRLSDMSSVDHILDNIWRCLAPEELAVALQVSGLWNRSIKANPAALARWKEAKEKWSENNSRKSKGSRKVRLLKTSPRKALGNVSNVIAEESLVSEPLPSPSTSSNASSASATASPSKAARRLRNPLPPALPMGSPSKFRHRVFADEASRLRPDEQLRSCPRCTFPCRLNLAENRAHCTRRSCLFDFCTKCMCQYHDDTPCRTSTRVSTKPTLTLKGCKNLDMVMEMASEATPTSKSSSTSSSSSSSRSSRRRMSNTVASEKSKSRLKRL